MVMMHQLLRMVRWVRRVAYSCLEQPADPSSACRPRLSGMRGVAPDARPKKDVKDLSSASYETILQLLGEGVEDAESLRAISHLLTAHILCAVSGVQNCTQHFEPSAPPFISLLLPFCLAQQLSPCTLWSREEGAGLNQQAAHPAADLPSSIT